MTVRERARAVLVPALLVVVFGLLALLDRQRLLVDDAYIAFRYAANFANGLGLTWNPGERVEGYTNLSWVLVLSLLARLRIDLAVASVVLSLAFSLGSLVVLHDVARRAAPEGNRLAWTLPGLLLATNPSFDNAATSGMETAAFGFLVLLGQLLLVRGREDPRFVRRAGVVYSLAYFTRPEGALACAVAATVEMLSSRGSPRERARRLAPVALIVGLVVLVHVGVRFAYYGFLLPNTFYAKVIFGHRTVLRGAAHIAGFFLAGGFLVLPGVLELERRGPARPFVLHGYALLGTYLVYLLLVGGDHPFWFRFYVPLLPLPLVATSTTLLRFLGRGGRAPSRVAAYSLALFTNVFGNLFAERCDVLGHVDPRARIAMDRVLQFFQREAPPGSLVAAETVGHVGYYARHLRILDMWGLNDVHIAHLDVSPNAKFGHDKFDLAYIGSKKPDYVYVLYASLEAVELPGYDLCWPSELFPIAVYRRKFSLGQADAHLGVPASTSRRLAPPPPCRPPKPGPRL
ncbi:MAG TPA: hypothetical protein VHE30_11300 [Polyangiaceae bacterium]|nr:hypothetical protein [Polyangiaceae bacterium]